MRFPKHRTAAYVLLVFLIFIPNPANGESFDEVSMVIKLFMDIIVNIFGTGKMMDNITKLTSGGKQTYNISINFDNEQVMTKLSEISNKIDAFEEKWEIRSAIAFENIIRRINEQNQLSSYLKDLNEQMNKISRRYRQLQVYSQSPGSYEKFTLERFAWDCVSFNDGTQENLETIHDLIKSDNHGFGNKNLLKLLIDSLQLHDGRGAICDSEQSPQQMLYNLYNSIMFTEIKGYAVNQFAWLLLKAFKKGNFTREMRLTTATYEARMAETVEAVQTAMAAASPDLWKCDPLDPSESGASTELTQLLQGYVVNEADLNNANTCMENCAYYDYTKVHSCYDSDNCSTLKRCNGKVYNCQFVDSDMWICPAKQNSARRYNHIEYLNGQALGQQNLCDRRYKRVNSWWRWLFWHCSYCFCFCDDPSYTSDRYFNLREVVADVESNKVITGLKFVKENQVIHLQIEQGELLERGGISHETEWKPVDAYSPFDYSVQDGVDYLQLDWNRRNIDLDELRGPADCVLTGVKFGTLGTHLRLEIRTTPFNFTTGVLVKNLTESTWRAKSNTPESSNNPRTRLHLYRPDRSTNSRLSSIPNFQSNQYIKFVATDAEKDVAQSTVPFIDTQPVIANPRVPIAGAGIYYKGTSGFGGYIAPKLRTYNFAPHLHIVKSTTPT